MAPPIGIGCQVEAKVGHLRVAEPPSGPQEQAGMKTKQRRTREVFTGIVIASAPNQHWVVYWINIQKCATHKYNALTYKGQDCENKFSVEQINILLTSSNLTNQAGIDAYLQGKLAGSANVLALQPPPIAPALPEESLAPPAPPLQAAPVPASPANKESNNELDGAGALIMLANTANTAKTCEVIDNKDTEEDVYDPNSIVDDIIAKSTETADQHIAKAAKYEKEKSKLLGKVVTVGGVDWTVRENVLMNDNKTNTIVGMVNFDFNYKPVKVPSLK